MLSGVITYLFKSRRICEAISQVSSITTVALTVILLFSFSGVEEKVLVIVEGRAVYSLLVDSLSVLVALAVSIVGFLILLFSTGYMSPENMEHPVKKGFSYYYGSMLIFMGSMLGLVFSGTLISLITFFELTGWCSWALIAFWHEETESRRAALKALLFTHAGGLCLYAATAIAYLETGSFAVSSLSSLESVKSLFLALVLLAAWAKSAQIPFYTWLPDAMVAPTPVSAYLHAAAMVKVGVYLLARVVRAVGEIPSCIAYLTGVLAVSTMLLGLYMYFPQVDFKRLLAYSTITQLAYMFLGLSFFMMGVEKGYFAAVMHLFNHAFAKSLFFLVAGSISYSLGTKLLTEISGLSKKLPIVAAGFTVAFLSITGVPPFNCFFSKFYILASGFKAGGIGVALSVIALVESIACFIWFLKWFQACVLRGSCKASVKPLPKGIKAALIVLMMFCLFSQYVVEWVMG